MVVPEHVSRSMIQKRIHNETKTKRKSWRGEQPEKKTAKKCKWGAQDRRGGKEYHFPDAALQYSLDAGS